MSDRICKKCLKSKPLDTSHFNLLSGGTYRWSCKDCMAAAAKQHHQLHPEQTAARRYKYKSHLRNAPGRYDETDVRIIRTEQDDSCKYCGVALRGGGEVDHKTPLSREGSNWPSNLALACMPCNRDKHNKTEQEFMDWRRRLGLPCR